MKEIIVATILPRDANIPIGFVKSLMEVRDYSYIVQEGPDIAMNRNKCWETAKSVGKPILFVDSDMVFTRADVERIEKHLEDKDIVTGVCVMSESEKGHPPAIFSWNEKTADYDTMLPKEEMHEVDACGAAFLAISAKVVEKLGEPFNPIFSEERKEYYGEDISFCSRGKEAGFKIWCDPAINIGHIKTKVLYYGQGKS